LYLLNEANATAYIIEQAGQVCGSAMVAWRKNSSVGRLYSIGIDPAFRGEAWAVNGCEHVKVPPSSAGATA
jgi:hypothetical protein